MRAKIADFREMGNILNVKSDVKATVLSLCSSVLPLVLAGIALLTAGLAASPGAISG